MNTWRSLGHFTHRKNNGPYIIPDNTVILNELISSLETVYYEAKKALNAISNGENKINESLELSLCRLLAILDDSQEREIGRDGY